MTKKINSSGLHEPAKPTKFSAKSQIQIGETIAVLLVFFVLVIVALIFYTKVFKGEIESEKEELLQLNSIGIAQRITFLPELQCSEDNIIIDNCIDILKLDSSQKIMKQNEAYYYDLLEFSDINVFQIYPNNASWNIYSRTIDNFKSKFVTNVPIALYNPSTRKNGFGILKIETFSK